MMKVVFRVDASFEIGMGHLYRCLALANQLQEKYQASIILLSRPLTVTITQHLREQGIEIVPLPDTEDDLPACLNFLRCFAEKPSSEKPDWFIVDHYGWDHKQEMACQPFVQKIFVIDDLANRPHHCDVLLDQNVYFQSKFSSLIPFSSIKAGFKSPSPLRGRARVGGEYTPLIEENEKKESPYQQLIPSTCRLLLGPRFALLRPEFAEVRAKMLGSNKHPTIPAQNILISFGGSDPKQLTLQILQSLHDLPRAQNWHIHVIIGRYHANRQSVEEATARLPHGECLYDVRNMAEQMNWADLYIGAGGTTTWERLCLGLPGIVIPVVPNQEALSQELAQAGIHLVLDLPLQNDLLRDAVRLIMINAALRESFTQKGWNLVDGRGTDRVAHIMRFMGALSFRKATAEDCFNLYQWRNHPDNREFSFQSKPVSETEHQAWFQESLANPERILLIGEAFGQPVGVLRFDLKGDDSETNYINEAKSSKQPSQAIISIYLCPGQKGLGVGSLLLEAGTQWLHQQHPQLARIEAHIQPENIASYCSFEKAGYLENKRIYHKELTHE